MGDDSARNTVAVILAGGKGTRLGPLTRDICKPALPFGAAYQNIDFSLSNCLKSRIRRIGVVTQYKPESLLCHVEDVWSKSARRAGEFIAVWPATTRAPRTGYSGTADAVFRNLDLLNEQGNELVLVLAGDHIYRMDYRPMLEFHRRRRAEVTIGCIEVPAEAASQFGILSVDHQSRVEHFVEKPSAPIEAPDGDHLLASMGIYVFDLPFLSRELRRDASSKQSRHDFGRDIFPNLVGRSAVYAFPFVGSGDAKSGYWRDVGTPAAYWQAHLELLDDAPSMRLDDTGWPLPAVGGRPVLTQRHARPGVQKSHRSLVAKNCKIDGFVNRSVVSAGVQVLSGSDIESSVILPGVVIGRNCRLSGAIVNSGCRVPDGTVIGPARLGVAGKSVDEPVIVTAEDFEALSIPAYA